MNNNQFQIAPSKNKICNLKSVICNSSNVGFTLLEVIIAFAILSVSLVMVMQLFSAGLKASRASCDYTRAVIYAKNIMEELSGTSTQLSGEFDDGYTWETEAEPYIEDEEDTLNLMQVKVKVFWDDALRKPKSLELVSLKAVESEETP